MSDQGPDRAQVLVIGGGPGGYAAAFHAADRGLDVTLISDEERLGGVCLQRGCIPTKALLSLADTILAADAAGEHGVAYDAPRIEIDRIREWKDGVVDELVTGLEALVRKRQVRVVRGRARFAGPRSVRIEGEDAGELAFEHAIIATGSYPASLPGLEFGERVLNSTTALDLTDIPGRLLVVGGGYIGLELGSAFAVLGSRVTVTEVADGLLPGVDRDLVGPLHRRLEGLLDTIRLETTVDELREDDEGVTARFTGSDRDGGTRFDRALVAVGRAPRSRDLGLSDAGVELADDGFIAVDGVGRTTAERIYAVGDVCGGQLLAHEAMHEGKVAAGAIAGEPAARDRRAIPAVIYTQPQLAWCGLTETAAREQERDVKVLRYPWRANGRAVSMGAADGMTRLLVAPDGGRLLGAGVVGSQAESLISELALALEMGALASDLALTVHPHPTLSETVGEAAELLLGGATHLGPDAPAGPEG